MFRIMFLILIVPSICFAADIEIIDKEKVSQENITISSADKDVVNYEVYKRGGCIVNDINKTVSFTVNKSNPELSWRLIYHDGKVKDLFESAGTTRTINDMFVGTHEECLSKIKELGLAMPLEEEK